MQYPSRTLRSGLSSKGNYVVKDGRDYYVHVVLASGIRTKIKSKVGGHSKTKYKDLGNYYLGSIADKLHFESKEQLIEYSKCNYSQREYELMLINKGSVVLPPSNKTKGRDQKSK